MAHEGLMEQDLSTLDVKLLHALSPQVISRQATINVVTIAHVTHGESIDKAIPGAQTFQFRNESDHKKTMKLEHLSVKIYKCKHCPRPLCYKAYGSAEEDNPTCDRCDRRMELLRHFCLTANPCLDSFTAAILNGVPDGVLFHIAANEGFPLPQTSELVSALETMRLGNVVPILILQDNVDLIEENEAKNQHEEMQRFFKATVVDGAPIVPITPAGIGMDVVLEYLVTKIPIPKRDYVSPAFMNVHRSSDPNKPGCGADELTGGEVGGCILKGVLRVGDLIEILPGVVSKDGNGNIRYAPIRSKITSLYAEQNELQFAVPGALIAVRTTIDPTLTIDDKLVGQALGAVGSLPEVYVRLEVTFVLLTRLLGKGVPVSKLCKGDSLMIYIGAIAAEATVLEVNNRSANLQLTFPVCTDRGVKIALGRCVERRWYIIGWGEITTGTPAVIEGSSVEMKL